MTNLIDNKIEVQKVWEEKVLFKTLAGSWLYGTNTDNSDVDVRGVCEMPITALLGLQGFEQYQPNNSTIEHPITHLIVPADTVIYGMNKFAILAMDCNPNIVELLFAPVFGSTCYTQTNKWMTLRDKRALFLSRKARHSFSGYAFSQLERIERHHKWLIGKIPIEPHPEDYGGKLGPDGASWKSTQGQQDYHAAHKKWTQYLEWQQNRNPARHALEASYGYDTKNALHLCRLILQGEELLQTGIITLPRPEAKWLLEVKNGLMSYEEIIKWSADKDQEIAKLEQTSVLPWGPDKKEVEKLIISLNLTTIDEIYN